MAGRINVDTDRRVDIVDITDGVAEEVKRSEIENGVCTVFVSHTTAGVTVNENESGLVDDIP
ncbi:MAG: YjbQ family protein, partial [Halobacteria archaeon]|nr:YjbQ family protein [Halobacteria archaeon]